MSVAVSVPQPPVTALACGPCWERKHQRVPAFKVVGATPMCQTCYAGGNEPERESMNVEDALDVIETRIANIEQMLKRTESKFVDIVADLGILADRHSSASAMAAGMPSPIEAKVRISDIYTAAAKRLGIPVELLRSKGRAPQVARARHIAMTLARDYGYSYPQIGAAFSKHHTTVMKGVDTIRQQEQIDRKTRSLLLALRQDLKNGA